jgi:hypothetical protein
MITFCKSIYKNLLTMNKDMSNFTYRSRGRSIVPREILGKLCEHSVIIEYDALNRVSCMVSLTRVADRHYSRDLFVSLTEDNSN